ncbi:MAG TPA: uroporphyrinogen decarboxylase family protein [Verrucomicrobiae bacterium]|nr:uroporphyrinogen decarboxylase family protein [Verrucomicrobiae bacterium]
MDRSFYLDLARSGARFPIGAHLVLCEKPDHDALLTQGEGLGRVIAETADRFRTPLALPLMDLMVEKADLLTMIGIPEAQVNTHHFDACPPDDIIARIRSSLDSPPSPRMRANCEAIRHVASRRPDLVPAGMAIGPFSLMTKLLNDPITPVFMAGSGVTGAEDPEVHAVEIALELAVLVIQRGIRMQVDAGARAVCVCEPAANKVYLSPRQLDAGADIFERLVMANLRRIKATLDELGADLILHDCGELIDPMIRDFATLDPAILSLGSSRKLWEDSRWVPKTTVLFGNLPTKNFYSDAQVPLDSVGELSRDLIRRMRQVGHPFILGSECDVLSVPGSEGIIKAKIERMMTCEA